MFSLLAPAPAEAQTTLWSSTLTVNEVFANQHGCHRFASADSQKCPQAMTQHTFTLDGTDYPIRLLAIKPVSAGWNLEIEFDVDPPTSLVGTTWEHVIFRIGGQDFRPTSASGIASDGFSWIIASGSTAHTALTTAATISVQLIDPRTTPTVSLSASPNPVQEGSPVTVTATLSRALSEDVSIPLNTAMMPQNSATVGAYDIAIPAGQTTRTHEFTAPQLEDGEMKQYQIAVDWWRMREPRPLDAKGSQSIAGVTVLDENADPHRVSVSDASGTEMENGYPRLCFAFTLNRAASHLIWVNYWTEDGTAVAGQDYRGVEPSNMAIAFEPGETRKRKCFSILDDNVEDSGETFSVVLANPHGAILGRDRGTGTIYNHEPTSLSSLTAEGASGEDGPFTALDIGAFAPATTAYAVTVPHGTTHVRLTPKALNRYLTITTGLDGKKKSQVPFGGGTGPAVALAVGENVLVVKTQLYTGQRQTYRVTVTREERKLSPDATLSALSVEGAPGADGTWTALDAGTFASAMTSYSASVPFGTTHVRLTATAADASATLKAGAGSSLTAVTSGTASAAIALDVGANALNVEVTAEDGTATRTYTVTVTRAARARGRGVAFGHAEPGN